MNELEGKLTRCRLRLKEFEFGVTYRPGIVNRAADSLSRLDSQANVTTPVDYEVRTRTISTNYGPSQDISVDDDEDLLPT